MIDDSALFHGDYDPAKARAYYLRTRKLKGRRPGTATPDSPGRGGRRTTVAPAVKAGGKANRSNTKSRRAELLAQKEALEKRLDHLREVLAKKVKEAKALQGKSKPKKVEKDMAPETQVDKADRNTAEKAAKPLSGKQKADKAKKAKETYEKEHPTTLSNDVEILQHQVKDIQSRIKKAVEDAREQKDKAGKKAPVVRPQAKPIDAPRGR
jgi:chaperonin cofactor prefoldin